MDNYSTDKTITALDRDKSLDTEKINGWEISNIKDFLEKGFDVLQLPLNERNKINLIIMFFKSQKELTLRAKKGQLSNNDLKLIKQVECFAAELQQIAENMNKLNNNL